MEKSATQTEEKPDRGAAPAPRRYIKVQLYLAQKDVLLLEEQRLKLMKQGQDVTRSRLISEAIRLLAKEGVEAKIGSRV